MIDFEAARIKMVESQLRTTNITSHSVLRAFLTVPREAFVPEALRPLAYVDANLEVAPGRFLVEPSPLAKLIQLGEVSHEDRVLVIGDASGYVAAILSLVADFVVSLDITANAAAENAIAALGQHNVSFVTGDLEEGHAAQSPYDRIFLAGSVEEIPPALKAQLGEAGRLIAVVGQGNAGKTTVIMREGERFSETTAFDAAIRPLPGFVRPREFQF